MLVVRELVGWFWERGDEGVVDERGRREGGTQWGERRRGDGDGGENRARGKVIWPGGEFVAWRGRAGPLGGRGDDWEVIGTSRLAEGVGWKGFRPRGAGWEDEEVGGELEAGKVYFADYC